MVRALAQLDGARAEEWALRHGLALYFGSSVKGEAGIDWDNKKERQALLQKIVADADGVLELARQAQGRFPADSPERQAIGEAAELLGQLLLQDVERQEDGPVRKDKPGPSLRCTTRRCATGAKAAANASTDIRLPWWWIPIPNW